MFEGAALVLLEHTGAKSGTVRTTPSMAMVEFGTERFPVVARELTGAEREDIYARQCAPEPRPPGTRA